MITFIEHSSMTKLKKLEELVVARDQGRDGAKENWI